MRLIVSFFLSLLIYVLIVFLFLNFLIVKKKEPEVLIHTAIIVPTKIKSIKNEIKSVKNVSTKKIKKISKTKKTNLKKGSKTNISKGGDVSFKDIFQNVKENVPTTPVKLQKQQMSRFKGLEKVENNLKKVKLLNVDISFENRSSSLKSGELNTIIKKISKIWYEISDIPGEYAKISVTNNDGKVEVVILDSNINQAKQEALINGIKNLTFNKNFDINILFQTKVNK